MTAVRLLWVRGVTIGSLLRRTGSARACASGGSAHLARQLSTALSATASAAVSAAASTCTSWAEALAKE